MDKYIYVIKRKLNDPAFADYHIIYGLVICETSQQKALNYWYEYHQVSPDFTYIEQLGKANDTCSIGEIMAKYTDC